MLAIDSFICSKDDASLVLLALIIAGTYTYAYFAGRKDGKDFERKHRDDDGSLD